VFASLVATAYAGGCTADDQKQLADSKTVGDKQDKCGKAALGFTGIDHDKFTQCAQKELSISAACSECYYAVADYGFKNCKAACLLGWCKSGCLSCTQPAQDDLAGCAGFTPAKADPCLETTSTGACSADDQKAISDPNTIGKKAGDCGKSAYEILSGKFDHDKFNACLTKSVGISSGCSECYAVSGEFGAKNCKTACLLGWCKQGCLDCVKPAQADLDTCTGFKSGSATPCLEASAGACSADDQKAISDPDTIGKKAGDCGKSAYEILSGKFDHDKFNACLTKSAGISSGCSECYAVSGEFGAKNCKTACLLGWCKQGCLDCVKPAQADLDTCTGFKSGSATPCNTVVV